MARDFAVLLADCIAKLRHAQREHGHVESGVSDRLGWRPAKGIPRGQSPVCRMNWRNICPSADMEKRRCRPEQECA